MDIALKRTQNTKEIMLLKKDCGDTISLLRLMNLVLVYLIMVPNLVGLRTKVKLLTPNKLISTTRFGQHLFRVPIRTTSFLEVM